MNHPFQSVLDGLTELHELMTNDTSAWQAWTDEFTTAYQFNKNAALVLEERMTADSPYHTLWIDGYTAVHGNSSFDAGFWAMSFKHLATKFGVPMSWMAALRFTAVADLTSGNRWGLKKLPTFVDEEGYCNESLWASHLDGVNAGLIENTEFPFQRSPEAVTISDLAKEAATQAAKSLDLSLSQYLEHLTDTSMDMTLPARGDDE
tara:strand:+ start:1239 stop:1853 length:615 start_codon:yes stop_codon:yes gene_type:complete